jgi:hypothetical protein
MVHAAQNKEEILMITLAVLSDIRCKKIKMERVRKEMKKLNKN